VEFSLNTPVPPVPGIYSAVNPPPASIHTIMCSAKVKDGMIGLIQKHPYFGGLPAGVSLFILHVGSHPTFHVAVLRP